MSRSQQTFASQSSFAKYGRKSKRELFLDQMNQVVPWSELLALVEPFCPRRAVAVTIIIQTNSITQAYLCSKPGPLMMLFFGYFVALDASYSNSCRFPAWAIETPFSTQAT